MGAQPDSSLHLLPKAVAGDRAALQVLLLAHFSAVESAVRARFSPELAAHLEIEDLIQEVLVDVHRGIKTYRETENANFVAWLRRVAENRIVDTVRRLRRLKRGGERRRLAPEPCHPGESLDDIWEWVYRDSNPPDRPLRREEARHAIQICLAGLPADQREAIVAHYFEHLDTNEVARRMGRTAGAVRELMRRARQNLSKLLGTASAWLSSR
jgi:RNA polymerase sigma-70 factor (ECF subfamily)